MQAGHVQMQLEIQKQSPLASADGHIPHVQQKEWHGQGHPVQMCCRPEALWHVLLPPLVVDVAEGGCQGEWTNPT